MPKTRRTQEEVRDAILKVKSLVAGGETVDKACDEVGIAKSVYWKHHNKTFVAKPGKHGKIDVSQLPPRPKKKGRGGRVTPKPVDMTDIGSVAQRIAKLDKKLRDIDTMVRERIDLVAVLVKLLKKKV